MANDKIELANNDEVVGYKKISDLNIVFFLSVIVSKLFIIVTCALKNAADILFEKATPCNTVVPLFYPLMEHQNILPFHYIIQSIPLVYLL
jgi:hypothetical protein